MLEKFHDALFANDNILFFDGGFSKVTFFVNEMGILGVDFWLLGWRNIFEKRKAFKKDTSKELTPVVWHKTRWWDWCLLEDEKKRIEPTFTDKVEKC